MKYPYRRNNNSVLPSLIVWDSAGRKNRLQDRGINLSSSTLSNIWGCATGWHDSSPLYCLNLLPQGRPKCSVPLQEGLSLPPGNFSHPKESLQHGEEWDWQNPNTGFYPSDTKKHSRVGQWLCLSQDKRPLAQIVPFTNGVANIYS